jgi:hypothetical protein
MPHLSAAATLELWQEAERRDVLERTLVLAGAAGGGRATPDELARMPLGRRDQRVLALHSALGGGALEATARCPDCGEPAEFIVDPEALSARARDATPPAAIEDGEHVVLWRSPDSRDVAAAAAAGDAAGAERVLLKRCVTSSGELDPAELPANARAALASAMADADPLAEVLLGVSCPACGAAFVADVDVGAFVWAELQAAARRLLREVDVLARAYGWTEAEVLALDDRRRAAYLELAREASA